MERYPLFLNNAGRLRSGWRLGLFVLIFALVMLALGKLVQVVYAVALLINPQANVSAFLADGIFRFLFLASAVLAGWICNRWLEGLRWRVLGLSFHANWLRDFWIGSLIGIGSLATA